MFRGMAVGRFAEIIAADKRGRIYRLLFATGPGSNPADRAPFYLRDEERPYLKG